MKHLLEGIFYVYLAVFDSRLEKNKINTKYMRALLLHRLVKISIITTVLFDWR